MSPSSTARSHKSPKSSSSTSSAARKTLTPQRKHRKMLRDGTSEVWPESVEQIFVQGLRQYWESPWATYSRGRSRWRNQYLVDHLRSAGITRTKKQVASHIQVLRNMWKGEAEYQLVAGGEELFQEDGLLVSPNTKERSPASASSGPSVKEERTESQSPLTSPTAPLLDCNFHSDPSSHSSSPIGLPSPNYFLNPTLPPPLALSSPCSSSSGPRRSVKDEPILLNPPLYFNDSSSIPLSNSILHSLPLPRNFISSVSVWAEGVNSLSIDVRQASLYAHSSRNGSFNKAVVCFRLCLPSLNNGSPTLHGFSAAIAFGAPWTTSALCVTRAYADNYCDTRESASLGLMNSSRTAGSACQPVSVVLPDSWLSRCRWRQDGIENHVVQDITVDGEDLLSIVYELQRTPFGPASAEFMGYNNPEKMRFTTGTDNVSTSSSSSFTPAAEPHCASPSSSLYTIPIASSSWSHTNTCTVPRSEDSSLYNFGQGRHCVSPLSPATSDMGSTAYPFSSSALFS
ncbi:uncharacterized protein STEHIDRAFT_118970 [Stereum hirsutum FP-91666 SS1]|uniref:uncharacterized protein n=1 Tax=Stereum hirsutum (strain FP-91666) TaxID=721885 RepID=UPI000440FDF8|nr:uncharacterized protein STEHIDRAFT_118970 [Stereum hirsutum FP-91666 SS1]EIM89880.1 hypothetical protein STEHIDRAFT_118970 [Stereum hirsutum FP-91666 SS1]